MNSMTILLIACVLLSFEDTYSRGETLKLFLVKGITEVSSNEIPNFAKYPVADTEPKRLALCQDGLRLVVGEDRDKKVEFFEKTPTEALKAYVLVGRDNVFQVVWAYKCPTSPLTYIRLCLDNTVQVISKISRPTPTFKEIFAYLILTAIDIDEANAEQIASAAPTSVAVSYQYDTDEMREEERFQMCKRAMQPTLEMGVRLKDNKRTGISKYYVVSTKSGRKDVPFQEDFMQLFDCPTEPKIYIYVDASEGRHSLWAIMRENEIAGQRPAFNIMGYVISPAISVSPHKDSVTSLLKGKDEKMTTENDNTADMGNIETQLREIHAELENKTEMSGDELAALLQRLQPFEAAFSDATSVQKEMFQVILSELLAEKYLPVADKLKEEERRKVCETAIKIISGRDVDLTADTIGPNLYYTIEEEDEMDSDSDSSTITITTKAFKCPSKPEVYIRIIKDSTVGNMVSVIVQGGDDLEYLTAKFKK